MRFFFLAELCHSNGYLLAKESFGSLSFSRAKAKLFAPSIWRHYKNLSTTKGLELPDLIFPLFLLLIYTICFILFVFFAYNVILCNLILFNLGLFLTLFDHGPENVLILVSNRSQMIGLVSFNINDWKYLVIWKKWYSSQENLSSGFATR